MESVLGTARYYANRFNGKKTASGEVFSQKKLTAAHPSLPFGTLVKVENLANSLSVIVKVNDRCRKHEEVFIDVSREAALELGFLRHGTAKVRITVVKIIHQTKFRQPCRINCYRGVEKFFLYRLFKNAHMQGVLYHL